MADTVSNSGQTVVNKRSSHVAQTLGETDTCKVPPGVPTPFPNAAPADRLGAGQTTNTFITGAPICLLRTHIGPQSDDGHAGTMGGVTSGTYRFEAQATAGSTDLFIEGDAVVRTGDPTHQNHANTDGLIVAGAYKGSAAAQMAELRKKCTLVKFEGVDSAGRHLGWDTIEHTGDPFYLDIYETDCVTFTSERRDTTIANGEANPRCFMRQPHTSWTAAGKVFPTFVIDVDVEPKQGVESFVVPGEAAVSELILRTLGGMGPGAAAPPNDPHHPGERHGMAEAEAGRQDYGAMWGRGRQQSPAGQQAIFNPGMQNAPAPAAGHGHGAHHEVFKGDVREILMWLLWWIYPPVIDVTATACGGPRNAKLKVFPRRKIHFSFVLPGPGGSRQARGPGGRLYDRWQRRQAEAQADQGRAGATLDRRTSALSSVQAQREYAEANARRESHNRRRQRAAEGARQQEQQAMARFNQAEAHFQQAVAALQSIKRICEVAQTIARVCGEEMTIIFLKDFELEVVCGYKHNTRNHKSPFREYTPATMGQEWELALQALPLLGVDYTAYVSILNFLVPFAGQWVGRILRRVVRVDLFFGAAIGIIASIASGKDHYDQLIHPSFTLGVDCNLRMGLAAGFAGIDVVRFTAGFPARGQLKFDQPHDRPGVMIQCTPAFRIRAYFTVVLFPDRWYEIEALSASPQALSCVWESHHPWPILTTPR
jgi:hypothetical protein